MKLDKEISETVTRSFSLQISSLELERIVTKKVVSSFPKAKVPKLKVTIEHDVNNNFFSGFIIEVEEESLLNLPIDEDLLKNLCEQFDAKKIDETELDSSDSF